MEKERVILGEGCFYSADSNETGLNNNIIVCGGSGSGKNHVHFRTKIIGDQNI